ncbi:hypothetical protein D3C76_801800 [compost metagenome]
MHLPGDLVELAEKGIAHRPQLNGFFQVADLAEVQVQPDEAGNVVRVVAALKNASSCSLQVRDRQIQGRAQFMPALRYGKGFLILLEDGLVAAIGVQVEVVDRVFLSLGPEALPRHITTHRRQGIQADPPQQRLKQHHGHKWPDDAQQVRGFESPFSLHEVPCTQSRMNLYSYKRTA